MRSGAKICTYEYICFYLHLKLFIQRVWRWSKRIETCSWHENTKLYQTLCDYLLNTGRQTGCSHHVSIVWSYAATYRYIYMTLHLSQAPGNFTIPITYFTWRRVTYRPIYALHSVLTSSVWDSSIASTRRRAGTPKRNSNISLLSVVVHPKVSANLNAFLRAVWGSSKAQGLRAEPLCAIARWNNPVTRATHW